MNILEPLCMDRRTEEHNQSYVTMHLCLKGQMNILEPLCMDRRTEEQTQTYVIMYLCQKRTGEQALTFMCRQKNRRTYSNLCHYVLMSKDHVLINL